MAHFLTFFSHLDKMVVNVSKDPPGIRQYVMYTEFQIIKLHLIAKHTATIIISNLKFSATCNSGSQGTDHRFRPPSNVVGGGTAPERWLPADIKQEKKKQTSNPLPGWSLENYGGVPGVLVEVVFHPGAARKHTVPSMWGRARPGTVLPTTSSEPDPGHGSETERVSLETSDCHDQKVSHRQAWS